MAQPGANELVLIRHAPADHGGRLCGRTDVPAVIDPVLAEVMRAVMADVPQHRMSPALRCRQTAAAIFPEIEITQDARLWEQDFGVQDGMRFEDLPDLGSLELEELAELSAENGESFADMVARVQPALLECAEAVRQSGTMAVVAHAGTVRAALALATGRLPEALSFEVGNMSVTRLRVLDGGFSVICTNWSPL